MDVRGDYEKDKAGGLGRLYPFYFLGVLGPVPVTDGILPPSL